VLVEEAVWFYSDQSKSCLTASDPSWQKIGINLSFFTEIIVWSALNSKDAGSEVCLSITKFRALIALFLEEKE